MQPPRSPRPLLEKKVYFFLHSLLRKHQGPHSTQVGHAVLVRLLQTLQSSKMEVSRNLIKFLHSYRSREDDVWTLSSRSVAKPYMVSHPLPAKITELEILISSKANREASADVPTKSRSWFEATIIRGCGAHWYDEAPDWTNETREIPEDFRDDIRARGWDFVPNQDVGQPSAVAFDVMDAHYGNEFSGFRRCVWAQSLDEDNSQGTAAQKFTPLKLIEEGDRFIIWLRATVSRLSSFSQIRSSLST